MMALGLLKALSIGPLQFDEAASRRRADITEVGSPTSVTRYQNANSDSEAVGKVQINQTSPAR